MPKRYLKNSKIGGQTKLRTCIIESGLSQEQVAKLSDVEIYQVSRLASGVAKDCLLSTAKKICNSINRTLDEAFGE